MKNREDRATTHLNPYTAMTRIFVGIDIAKDSFQVAIPQAPQRWQDHHFANSPAGFADLLAELPAHCQCILEASGTYYLPLASFLHQQGVALSVVNPLVVKRFGQMLLRRAKTDKADARLLSEFGTSQQPALWQAPPLLLSQLQQLQTLLEQYIKQRTALRNQQEAFSHSGIPNAALEESLRRSLDHLQEQIKSLEEQMDQLAQKEFASLYEHLLSIPGIGRKTALTLLVITRGFSRFNSAKELASFVGLAPRVVQSGTSVRGKGHICKLGQSRIRQLLYMAGMQASKVNAGCMQLYERLLRGGKPKLVALIAVAHKLLRQAFAVARQQRGFDQNLACRT
jgi:transposase